MPGPYSSLMHATESAVEVRRARRRLGEAATDERVGLFTPDKDGYTHTSRGRVPVLAARRGTVCGEVGRSPISSPLTTHSPQGPHTTPFKRFRLIGNSRHTHCAKTKVVSLSAPADSYVVSTHVFVYFQTPHTN